MSDDSETDKIVDNDENRDVKDVKPKKYDPAKLQEQDAVMFEHYEKFKSILQQTSKVVDINQKKSAAWESIAEAVNALGGSQRSAKQVSERFRHLTSAAKKKNGERKKYSQGTGGGPPAPPMTPSEEKVMEIFAKTPAFDGIENQKQSIIGKRSGIRKMLLTLTIVIINCCIVVSKQIFAHVKISVA